MPNLRSRLRSELPVTTETTLILNKIKGLLAQSARHVSFEKGSFRANAGNLSQVVVDPTLSPSITYQQKPFTGTAATVTIQNVVYTADAVDATGNAITIAYTTGATAGSEVVTVTGNAISVQIQTGVTTATQLVAALNASAPASALINPTITGTASTPQTAPVAPTPLTGGVTAGSLERYATTDIKMIRRLRNKKWMIEIKADAVSS